MDGLGPFKEFPIKVLWLAEEPAFPPSLRQSRCPRDPFSSVWVVGLSPGVPQAFSVCRRLYLRLWAESVCFPGDWLLVSRRRNDPQSWNTGACAHTFHPVWKIGPYSLSVIRCHSHLRSRLEPDVLPQSKHFMANRQNPHLAKPKWLFIKHNSHYNVAQILEAVSGNKGWQLLM